MSKHLTACLILVLALAVSVHGAVKPAPNFNISEVIGFWWIVGTIDIASPFQNTSLTTTACPTISIDHKDTTTAVTMIFNYTYTPSAKKVVDTYHFKLHKDSQAILYGHDMELVFTYYDEGQGVAILVESNEKFLITLSRKPSFDQYSGAISDWLARNITPPIDTDNIVKIDNYVCMTNAPIVHSLKASSLSSTWYVNMRYYPKLDTNKCQFMEFTPSKVYSSFYHIAYYVDGNITGQDEFLPILGEGAYWVPAFTKGGLAVSYKLPNDDVYIIFSSDSSVGFIISKKATLDQKQSGLVLAWLVDNGYSVKNVSIINNTKCTKP